MTVIAILGVCTFIFFKVPEYILWSNNTVLKYYKNLWTDTIIGQGNTPEDKQRCCLAIFNSLKEKQFKIWIRFWLINVSSVVFQTRVVQHASQEASFGSP